MKWVTRDYVHLDRVASPWLITRFIDREAEFVFVPWGEEDRRPVNAIPFGIAGVEIGPHDADGTTFQKLLVKYALDDPALVAVGRVVAAGVNYVLHGYKPEREDRIGQIAVGLLAISDGMMLTQEDDAQTIRASFFVYDALFTNFRAGHLLESSGHAVPPSAGRGPTNKVRLLRQLLAAQPALPRRSPP